MLTSHFCIIYTHAVCAQNIFIFIMEKAEEGPGVDVDVDVGAGPVQFGEQEQQLDQMLAVGEDSRAVAHTEPGQGHAVKVATMHSKTTDKAGKAVHKGVDKTKAMAMVGGMTLVSFFAWYTARCHSTVRCHITALP
jgi:hypothetical protein